MAHVSSVVQNSAKHTAYAYVRLFMPMYRGRPAEKFVGWQRYVTFRPLVKQTTTQNLYITIYIYFLDGRLCEVEAVRRGIRIVRRWGLNFSMSGDDGRDNAQRERFREQRDTFSLSSSVQFVGLILLSNSHAGIKTRLYASAIFLISGDWDVLLPLIWNGLCDRRRAEITVIQFTGHSLPVHHWSGTFTLSHIISRAHLRAFFRLLAIGMCHIRYLRNWRCDHHRAEITIMQFIGQSLPAHHFFYGTVRIFTLSHIVSQAVFYRYSHSLFFSIVPLAVQILLIMVLQCLDLIARKCHHQ